MTGRLPNLRTSGRSKSGPSSWGNSGSITRLRARPARRLVPACLSFRALEPSRANLRRRSSMNRWTSLSRLGRRCTSSTITQRPGGTRRSSWPKSAGSRR